MNDHFSDGDRAPESDPASQDEREFAEDPKSERDLIMERFMISVKRLPRYGRLAANMMRDDRVPVEARTALVAGAAYVISPVDLIPGFIPVLGQLDDLLVALLGIRFALAQAPVDVREEHLERVGLYEDVFSEDMRTVRDTSLYLLKSGGRRVASGVERVARRAGRSVRSVTRRGDEQI